MAWFFLPQGSDAKVDVLVFSGLSAWYDQFCGFQLRVNSVPIVLSSYSTGTSLGAIHKRHRTILRGEGVLNFDVARY